MVSWDQAVEPVGSNQNAGFMPVKNRVELVPACAWIHFSEESKNLPAPGFEDGLVMHVQPHFSFNLYFLPGVYTLDKPCISYATLGKSFHKC